MDRLEERNTKNMAPPKRIRVADAGGASSAIKTLIDEILLNNQRYMALRAANGMHIDNALGPDGWDTLSQKMFSEFDYAVDKILIEVNRALTNKGQQEIGLYSTASGLQNKICEVSTRAKAA